MKERFGPGKLLKTKDIHIYSATHEINRASMLFLIAERYMEYHRSYSIDDRKGITYDDLRNSVLKCCLLQI